MGLARSMLMGLVVAGTAATAAQADTIRSLFGDGTQKGCYKRVYDDAHFAKNPQQRVKVITFDFQPEADNTARQSYGPVGFGISVVLRSKADGSAGGVFYCKDSTGKILCSGESDAGTVEVSRQGSDAIMLRVTRGLSFETSTKKGSIDLEEGPDDKVFVLRKAPVKACDILR